MRIVIASLAFAAVIAALDAQQLVVPEHAFFAHSGASGSTWRAGEFHFQMLYDSALFTRQGATGPIAITRLRFRAQDGAVSVGGVNWPQVNVQLSSSPLDVAAASTAFAQNRGADVITCFAGAVTSAATAGGAPNGVVVDLALATPFAFDPSLGRDLCIEVDASAPTGAATLPFFATSSLPSERCRRVAATTQAATMGTLSDFANVVLIDFTGPGGYPNWVAPSSVDNGTGCIASPASIYEEWPASSAFDLANSTTVLTPNASGGYTLTRGPAVPFAAHAQPLGLADDSVAVRALPAAFGAGLPYPGGVASSVGICSNGYLWLGNATVADATPTRDELLAGAPRLAPLWLDLLPGVGADVDWDVDPSGTAVYATWNAVPCFAAPSSTVSMQVALRSNGVVEFRYGACAGSNDAAISGWSPGLGAIDPGPIDLSATTLLARGAEVRPLTLRGQPLRLGTNGVHTITNIPATALLTARLLSVLPVPGIDLGAIGAPGCRQYVDGSVGITSLVFGGPTGTAPVIVPSTALLLGMSVYAQAASLVPGVNALGLLTSNQNVLVIGNS